MKQVIFLCLLSLSLCLSKPAESEAPPTHEVVKAGDNAKAEIPKDKATPPTPTQTQPTSNPIAIADHPLNNTVPAHEQSPKSNNTATADDSNKTTEKKDSSTTAKTTESAAKVETSTSAVPAADGKKTNSSTKPEDKDSKVTTTTVGPVSPKSTEVPKTTETPKTTVAPKDEDKHVVQARGFDGPSFIGGIILSLGLLAIGFMGFKYYKNQTERNYHTL